MTVSEFIGKYLEDLRSLSRGFIVKTGTGQRYKVMFVPERKGFALVELYLWRGNEKFFDQVITGNKARFYAREVFGNYQLLTVEVTRESYQERSVPYLCLTSTLRS